MSPIPRPTIPPPGTEWIYSMTLASGYKLTVTHGSSPSLISAVCEFVANTEEDHDMVEDDDGFDVFDPAADHQKWAYRSMKLSYVAVVDPATKVILCGLRTATKGIMHGDTNVNGGSLLVIDYIYTLPSARNEGIGALLLEDVRDMAQGAPCYVVSMESSLPFWVNKHKMEFCTSVGLKQLLNLFDDTILLQQQRQQLGSPAKLAADEAVWRAEAAHADAQAARKAARKASAKARNAEEEARRMIAIYLQTNCGPKQNNLQHKHN